jgi:hypothetical protein
VDFSKGDTLCHLHSREWAWAVGVISHWTAKVSVNYPLDAFWESNLCVLFKSRKVKPGTKGICPEMLDLKCPENVVNLANKWLIFGS